MSSAIIVTSGFDAIWPLAADQARRTWERSGPVEFHRLTPGDDRAAGAVLADPARVERLLVLGADLTPACAARLTALREVAVTSGYQFGGPGTEALAARGVRVHAHTSEGFWGESVAEFGLALTLCGLRRIPQLHRQMVTDQRPWDYSPDGRGRGQQFGDDPRFTCGTIAGKRVRIVGAGNIGSRYASFCTALGADVAAWDPFAAEPAFHRAGARREHHLERLVMDAEIFAPMLPLTEKTAGLVNAGLIAALPKGTLVILVTRAGICDMPALRRRVLADELALAADVFDVEPLPLNDPLLGRPNVVHTPHNAGRTRHANEQWVEMLLAKFVPRG
ncbi:MAG: hydroxyacid dehydrogenase [Verrucomicrobia bacterium]|nr:hydroxyacid dehydrogenase [Verrucomicrobiota bacterium]